MYARDKGRCGICGDPVDADLPWPDRGSKTIDHIVPLSKGGEHSWANVQLAHASCNSKKGAKTGTMPTNQAGDVRCASINTERLGDNTI